MRNNLLPYGLIPEFIGRLPVVVALDALDEEALVRILVEPKNALVKQFTKLFEMDGVELEFNEDALREVAIQAMARKTGARGLRSIFEENMMEIMFDIPSDDKVKRCIVTKEAIAGTEKPRLIRVDRKEKEETA